MRKRRRWICVLGVFVLLSIGDYWLYPVLARPGGSVVNRDQNAIWLRYTWYFGQHSNEEISQLGRRLQANGISDAYFHVRSIESEGQLKYRYLDRAQALNASMRQVAPGVRRIAWIYAGNAHGLGHVRLGDPSVRRLICRRARLPLQPCVFVHSSVRRRMVEEAVWLVRKCGFDGVQWDYEICDDGDTDLLRLLEENRRALPDKFLGVAVPTWYPPPLSGVGWSEAYYRRVAQRCDQVAVMAYDSAAYSPRLYAWFVSEQVSRITRAAAGSGCRVILGVPTYDDGTASHNPRAENLRIALVGVRDGLTQADLSSWQGVGIFADYTTDESEWHTWRDLWPRQSK